MLGSIVAIGRWKLPSTSWWALGLASAQRQRLKPKESTTCHEDRAVQRITLCRSQKALDMGRKPFRQRLRESTDQTDGGTPDISKPFNDTCSSVCCFLDYSNGYGIFRRCILNDEWRKFGIVGRSGTRSKTNDFCGIPLEAFEYGCRKFCSVASPIKGPKCTAECFPAHSLTAGLIRNFGTVSGNNDAPSVGHSQTTGTGAEYHYAAVRGLVSAKPSNVSIGLKRYRCKQSEFRTQAVARAFNPGAG